MEFKIVKLKFNSPLLLSKGSVDYTDTDETLHSDTLKNALFVCARQLFGKEKVNADFFNQFTIGSAFPFYKDEYFLPKPFIKLNLIIDKAADEHKTAKKKKKLQWLGKSLFEAEINAISKDISSEKFSSDGKFVSENFIELSVYKSEEQQHVRINYDTDAEPFYTLRIHFESEAGLYVLIDAQDDFFNEILQPAFRLLGDNGIGSYKNLGNGQFEPEFCSENFTLQLPSNPNAQTCLSLFCPQKEELSKDLLKKASYMLVKRGGYLASPEDTDKMSWRKKSIYMFQEGSVFPAGFSLKGKLADVTPEGLSHKVYRDGQAVFIPVKITEDE